MRSAAVASLALVLAFTATGCPPRRKVLACERPVVITPPKAGEVLWFGEMHGTDESPRFVGDIACMAARTKQHVQLGLEIWATEQPAIDKYLENGDLAALLAGPFWSQHDGRSSTAMVALLDRVRTLRRAGALLDVVAYDVIDKPDRDAAMAIKVIAARDANGVFVGLSGNIHSRRTKWNETEPLVMQLIATGTPVNTHDVSAAGGEMWACMATDDHEPVCGAHPNSIGGAGAPWTFGPAKDASHDGVYYVGPTKAAFPAKP